MFNWEIYINNYYDLLAAGINNRVKALAHWNRYGKKERRIAHYRTPDSITNIRILLGMGDILEYLHIYSELGLLNKVRFLIDNDFLEKYRANTPSYVQFIRHILYKFGVQSHLIDGGSDYRVIGADELVINHKISFRSLTKFHNYFSLILAAPRTINHEYIVIHTKYRPIVHNNVIERQIKNYVRNLFSDFKAKLPIVLLGEKEIEPPRKYEMQGIYSLYNELITSLSNKNTIIDLTVPKIQLHYDVHQFEKDISIIHNAECNIIFGVGGNLILSLLLGKRFIALSENYFQEMFKTCSHGTLCKTYQEMTNAVGEIRA
ncbi:MAG: hypothetical protein Hyperionvirus2_38 [Hyperionvirus sp.]|uniref:Uncharacterized protein n=1 Tax=Hyperionvirus sp. TaxID=2487770 RepID=A0A3G5A5Y2_9VIRU|nr:MAG: hypothetical protein Hyperionvirus2_38 [Hyperionvirus sp.]